MGFRCKLGRNDLTDLASGILIHPKVNFYTYLIFILFSFSRSLPIHPQTVLLHRTTRQLSHTSVAGRQQLFLHSHVNMYFDLDFVQQN